MQGLSWLALLAGTVLALAVLIDVFLTVLHLDFNGPVARWVFRTVWRLAMALSRLAPHWRRPLVSLAGPLMVAAVFITWIGMFVFAFALLYWPFLENFRSANELPATGFAAALYFSGVTATVLGYGDLTPVTAGLQLLSFIQSALGFAMLTGIVTFLISLISGVAQRDALTMNLAIVGGYEENAATAIAQRLDETLLSDLCTDLHGLVHDMQRVYQQMRHFPVLDLYYRQSNPAYAPERLIQSAAALAIAGQLASCDARYRRLQPLSRHLGQVTFELMERISSDHLDRSQRRQLAETAPTLDDQLHARLVAKRLDLADSHLTALPQDILQLICHSRAFLDQVDAITEWRRDQPVADHRTS